jgi:dTDP-glucose 4,6-dehydratase
MPTLIITGAAGFLGSHLCAMALGRGYHVVAVDNLVTGSLMNLQGVKDHPNFRFVEFDVTQSWGDLLVMVRKFSGGQVAGVLHFASPASPPQYLRIPIETLRVGSVGTEHALQAAQEFGARFILARTSEVYGSPTVHPQPESYWGNVNSIGPRSCYDEAKRYAEALTMAYHRHHGVDVGIVRIFNTYGPNLAPGDGRVVSNFIRSALLGEPLTVYGDGSQTRSLCYVDDLVRGIFQMFDTTGCVGPVNLGTEYELTVLELAQQIIRLAGSSSSLVHRALPADDPTVRRPDLSLAKATFGYRPTVSVEDGLTRTIAWLRTVVTKDPGAMPPIMPGTELTADQQQRHKGRARLG